MIELRLRAATSNPSSRPWQWGVSLTVLLLTVIAPVATSRAQDAASTRAKTLDLEHLRSSTGFAIEATRDVVIDAGDSVTIKNGAASITMKKDGTIVLKGTEIIVNDGRTTTRLDSTPPSPAPTVKSRASLASEIF